MAAASSHAGAFGLPLRQATAASVFHKAEEKPLIRESLGCKGEILCGARGGVQKTRKEKRLGSGGSAVAAGRRGAPKIPKARLR